MLAKRDKGESIPGGRDEAAISGVIASARKAQKQWAATTVQQRLQIIRRLRHEIASDPEGLAATVPTERAGSLHRTVADTLVAEVLPLLEACHFLEREAAFILAPRHESTTSRPVWLGGVSVETRRDPLGIVLIIAPGNYPLYLPGVQALQALAAGNAVLWKPAPGGKSAALALQRMLFACGLDPALLAVLSTEVAAATEAIRSGVDKVVLTGSATTGRAVLRELAEMLTPAIMELSGCDAVFVLPGADLDRAAKAIVFGLTLNGSATCMAPRRLFVTDTVAEQLIGVLAELLASPSTPSGPTPDRTHSGALDPAVRGTVSTLEIPEPAVALLRELIDEATLYGAKIVLNGFGLAARQEAGITPTLLDRVSPEMRIAQTDIFAPVLSVIRIENEDAAIAAHRACPYALTAAIFGPSRQAEELAARVHAGTVLINDMIVPTADPRASFSGRGQSGFGATRGREGLLEMTATKTILRQSSTSQRPYQPTGDAHIPFFAGLVGVLHAHGWRARLAGAKQLVRASMKLK